MAIKLPAQILFNHMRLPHVNIFLLYESPFCMRDISLLFKFYLKRS